MSDSRIYVLPSISDFGYPEDERLETSRKFKEYEMKIIKMAGYLSDYYLDRSIESDDYSNVASFLIDYFSGSAGRPFDVGYLVSKYKEYGLNEKAEDIDFNVDEWYKIIYEIKKPKKDPTEYDITKDMTEEEYINYMIEKRKKSFK
jgi:hypothetical protein